MATERTPRERAVHNRRLKHVRAVIDDITSVLTSWMLAEELDEPADVCEHWVNAMWDGLRERLNCEDRLLAILVLLEDDARRDADRLLSAVKR